MARCASLEASPISSAKLLPDELGWIMSRVWSGGARGDRIGRINN